MIGNFAISTRIYLGLITSEAHVPVLWEIAKQRKNRVLKGKSV
jgi:hypothetical protein